MSQDNQNKLISILSVLLSILSFFSHEINVFNAVPQLFLKKTDLNYQRQSAVGYSDLEVTVTESHDLSSAVHRKFSHSV